MKLDFAIVLALGSATSPALAQFCFEAQPDVLVNDSPVRVTFADLDADGDLDMGTLDPFGINLSWSLGDGSWSAPMRIFTTANPSHLEFADVDLDGDADIVHSNSYGVNTVSVRRNLGAQTFGSPAVYAVSFSPEHFVCADLDNDGDLDIPVACSGAGTGGGASTRVLFNQGSGTFTLGPAIFSSSRRLAVADFDVDGDRDIAIILMSNVVSVVWNDGTGAFPGPQTFIVLGAETMDVAAGDLDRDGRPDLAIGQGGNRFSILRSLPGGTFTPYVEFPMAHSARRLAEADFDGDGDLDLAAVDWLASVVTVFANAGNATFSGTGAIAMPAAFAIESIDVDGDDDADLALPLQQLDSVRFLRNCRWSGVPGCFGDGSATACPCGNASPPGAGAGCLHSFGTGGTLRASGAPSISADSIDLLGGSMPDAPALYVEGTSTIQGGLGQVFGDGLSCAGGTVTRVGTATNIGGASQVPGAGQPRLSVLGGVTVPGERHYQVWYRNAASFCTPPGFNLTNSLRLIWRP